jgi:hypothetical protein
MVKILTNMEEENAMAETMTRSSKQESAIDNRTPQVLSDLEQQRKQVDQRMRPELEEQRQQAQHSAGQSLDREAIAAIQQTERAVNAITEARIDEALAAIEQATGKIKHSAEPQSSDGADPCERACQRD